MTNIVIAQSKTSQENSTGKTSPLNTGVETEENFPDSIGGDGLNSTYDPTILTIGAIVLVVAVYLIRRFKNTT